MDRAPFRQVVEANLDAVYRYCRVLAGPDLNAEDILQETFLAAMRGYDDFRGDSQVRTWLFTIARHAAHHMRRKHAGEPSQFDELKELGIAAGWGTLEPADVAIFSRERRQLIQNALMQLNELDREVLLLRDVEGMSSQDVAAFLGTSDAAVRTRLHRSRLRMMALLQNAGVQHAE